MERPWFPGVACDYRHDSRRLLWLEDAEEVLISEDFQRGCHEIFVELTLFDMVAHRLCMALGTEQ